MPQSALTMPIDALLVTCWALVAAAVWFVFYYRAVRALDHLRAMDDLEAAAPEEWPTVSILVPARNEAKDLEAALESLRALDYPSFELVVVDDRSSDGTGELIECLAEEDDRIRPLHIDELPDGWLGKVHALERARRVASGDWVLMTDADVEHDPSLLRRAVAAVLDEGADHLSCIPHMRDHDFWNEVAYGAFVLSGLQTVSIREVEDPETDAFMGVGAFNLVRRPLLEEVGGFEPIRMEVADDLGVGQLVQEAGGVTRIATATELLEVTWYPSLGDMIAGLEKNAFGALARYSYLRAIGVTLFWLVVATGPVAGLAAGPIPVVILSAAVIVSHPIVSVAAAVRLRRPLLPALFRFVGQWIMFYVFLRSTYLCWRRGGIRWRGTEYPVDELRDRQRVNL